MTSRRIKFGVFAFLLLGVVLVCSAMVGRELILRQKEKDDFEQLVKLVNRIAAAVPDGIQRQPPPLSFDTAAF